MLNLRNITIIWVQGFINFKCKVTLVKSRNFHMIESVFANNIEVTLIKGENFS